MNERIQKALDGELPREALGAEERAELDAIEEAADAALAALRAEGAPDLTRAIMHRVAALPRHGRSLRKPAWKRALGWLWAPRPVTLRPAWALAAAAALAGLLVIPWSDRTDRAVPAEGGTRIATQATSPGAATERVFVHFRLDAPDASSVRLAADFTDWQPAHTLNETTPGVWTLVVAVEPGVHQYAFVVDGDRWVTDPLAPTVDDGFGGSNSRLDVMTPAPAATAL